MQKLVNEIRRNYKVDGENERYIEIYNSVDEILNQMDKEGFEGMFLESYVQKTNDINELSFPVVTFDASGVADGEVYESDEDKEDILEAAREYFERKE